MSSQDPLASILINNYNYGRFLRPAIDSSLKQTYANTEVIIVDDGSTDDSREIIASYGSSITPIFKDNGGQASAFNAGFAASRGAIICFLDSDDVLLPTKVQMVVNRFKDKPDAVMIYHAYQRTDSELRPLGKVLPLSFLEGDVGQQVLKCGGCWPFPPPSAFAFRRSFLASCMPIPEEPFHTCADACLAYSTPILGRIAAIKESLCLYRMHGSNLYAGRATRDMIRLARYELNVRGVNQMLAGLGRLERLNLKDHISYLITKYFADTVDRPSWAAISWKLACMSSEPSYFLRGKELVKFWLESLGAGQLS